TLLNAFAWRSAHATFKLQTPPNPPLGKGRARGGLKLNWYFSGSALDRRDILLCAGLGLIAGLIAVLPLLAHGILAPIGNSWDVEFYLPLATYLRDYSYAQLGQAPANPLVMAIQTDPTYARAIGFAYFQGVVDSLGGWDALRTFAPLLGLMRLLAAPAVYLFARYGLRIGRFGAGLAALLVSLNELLLWVDYTGYAMHTSSMPLLPIALLALLLALREPTPRA